MHTPGVEPCSVFGGRRRRAGRTRVPRAHLGSVRLVTLAEARDAALADSQGRPGWR